MPDGAREFIADTRGLQAGFVQGCCDVIPIFLCEREGGSWIFEGAEDCSMHGEERVLWCYVMGAYFVGPL